MLIKRIFTESAAVDIREEEISWQHHHMGTCRTGGDPKTSVVDRNLRVHESSNLYVVGSSVFVTGGASPPTLTIAALSHRLADHIIKAIKSRNNSKH